MIDTRSGVGLQSLEFCQTSRTYRARYDPETTSPGMAVAALLSKVLDVDPTELEPLHGSVDIDALNNFVEHATDADVDVSFEFEGYGITVCPSHVAVVAPPDEQPKDLTGSAHQ